MLLSLSAGDCVVENLLDGSDMLVGNCCAAPVAHGCATLRTATATAPNALKLRLHTSGSVLSMGARLMPRGLTIRPAAADNELETVQKLIRDPCPAWFPTAPLHCSG